MVMCENTMNPAAGVDSSSKWAAPARPASRASICSFRHSTNHAPCPTPSYAGQDADQGRCSSLWLCALCKFSLRAHSFPHRLKRHSLGAFSSLRFALWIFLYMFFSRVGGGGGDQPQNVTQCAPENGEL